MIPVQFQDREFTFSEDDFKGIISSAQNYLDEQFRQTVTFTLDIAPAVTLDKEASYYGRNGEREHDLLVHEAVISACKASESMDFSLYDNDSDGTADVVILLTAGCSETDGAGEDEIWPAWSFLSNRTIPIVMGKTRIDQYVIFTEIKSEYGENPVLNGPGDLCHEICHVFGLPDFYDTDGQAGGGLSPALWKTTSIMDEGNRNNLGQTPPNFNSIEMEILGLGEALDMEEGKFTLTPLHKEGKFLKIASPEDPDEYILLECRTNDGWDSFIGGKGMLAYHVDKRKPTWYQKWVDNTVNTNPEHQCAHIVPAAEVPSDVSEVFFPHGTVDYLDLGQYGIDLSLKDICLNADGSVTFDVIEPIRNVEINSFQDAVIISWETDASLGKAENAVMLNYAGDLLGGARLGHQNTAVMEGLRPQTEYGYVIASSGSEGIFSKKGSFTTKKRIPGIPPYIILSGAEKDDDGYFVSGTSIPLRVNNLPEGSTVEWFLNGERISISSNGYYTVSKGGTLKARVLYEDGSTDVIIKEITVK